MTCLILFFSPIRMPVSLTLYLSEWSGSALAVVPVGLLVLALVRSATCSHRATRLLAAAGAGVTVAWELLWWSLPFLQAVFTDHIFPTALRRGHRLSSEDFFAWYFRSADVLWLISVGVSMAAYVMSARKSGMRPMLRTAVPTGRPNPALQPTPQSRRG